MLALQILDIAVVLLALAVAAAVAVYHFGATRESVELLFARGKLSRLPLGLSLAAAMVGGAGLAAIPGEGYEVGARWFVAPLASLAAAGLAAWLVVPYFARLGVLTPYEYLELRYDPTLRAVASALFLAWRGVWLVGVLCLPCRLLAVAGIELPAWLLILLAGLAGTLLAAGGGLRGAVWQDVGAFFLLVAALTTVLLTIAADQPGGLWQAAREASDFGRGTILDSRFDASDPWSGGTALAYFLLLAGVFFVADQWPAQRWLAAAGEREAQGSIAVGAFSGGAIVALLAVIGIGLLLYYDRHPEQLRPIWVANVDPQTRRPLTVPETRQRVLVDPRTGQPRLDLATGEPLIDPTDGRPLLDLRGDALDAASLPELVAAGRVLNPNTGEPYADAAELLDPLTGDVDPRKLLKRRLPGSPHEARKRPEIVLHRDAGPELLPHFLRRAVPAGLRGIVLAALLGLMLSAFQTGTLAAAGVLHLEAHRHAGIAQGWLAERVGKPPEELTEADELQIARPLTMIVGGGATLLALLIAGRDDWAAAMAGLGTSVGGPLLAVLALGIVTRHVTGRAALIALGVGIPTAMWVTYGPECAARGHTWLWPFGPLASNWGLIAGTLVTAGLAWLLGWFVGERRSDKDLRGLVLGLGDPGARDQPPPAKILVPDAGPVS